MRFDDYLATLEKKLPEWFSRRAFADATGLFTVGTLANMDSAKKGPIGKRFGKRVLYEKRQTLAWLRAYLENLDKLYVRGRGI